ncbi:MAG TPA: hypothetical protein VFP68_16515 [Burkholderiaceae bacterium]|nr:hypothetical protein [Burkholderiaceae bacterium]
MQKLFWGYLENTLQGALHKALFFARHIKEFLQLLVSLQLQLVILTAVSQEKACKGIIALALREMLSEVVQ